MTIDPFKAITVKEPIRSIDLRNAFRNIGSTPVSKEWLDKHTGLSQDGLTLIEVLILKLYKRALEDDDTAALDRILKFCDEGGSNGSLVSVTVNNQLEHGAQAIFERLSHAASGKVEMVEEAEYEEIPEF
jgi:hypothetical protein